jgi:hypothetical protein
MYYCSALWSNTSQRNIEKLQAVQNFAALIVTGTRKYDHVTPVLQQLGWLPVKYIYVKTKKSHFCFQMLEEVGSWHHRICVRSFKSGQMFMTLIHVQGKKTFWIFQCTDQLRVNEHFIMGLCPCGILFFKIEYKRVLLEEFLTESSKTQN